MSSGLLISLLSLTLKMRTLLLFILSVGTIEKFWPCTKKQAYRYHGTLLDNKIKDNRDFYEVKCRCTVTTKQAKGKKEACRIKS